LKITKQIRRFKKVLKSHHLKKIWAVFFPKENVGFEKYADFDSTFTEDLKLSEKKQLEIGKYSEIEIYIRLHHLIYLVHNKDLANV
jgi:hypothetical protein